MLCMFQSLAPRVVASKYIARMCRITTESRLTIRVVRSVQLLDLQVQKRLSRSVGPPVLDLRHADRRIQHIASSHPEFRCKACGQNFSSEASLEGHYRDSSKHPTCPECKISFIDDRALAEVIIVRIYQGFENTEIENHSARLGGVQSTFARFHQTCF